MSTRERIVKILICLTSFAGCTHVANAQPAASASEQQSLTASETQPNSREARKIARKQARAKRQAELGALKKKGYDPYGADLDYPKQLDKAQQGASTGK